MNTLGERLRAQRKSAKMTQEELAKKAGVTKSAISQYESGLTKKMDGDKLLSIAKALSLSPEWLMYGKGKPEKQTITAKKTNLESDPALVLGTFDVWDDETPLDEDDVELPFFREVELSAGSGRTQVQENHGLKLRFSKRTLKRQGVQLDHAACVTVAGNSMEPVLPDGCTIGIDTSKKQIDNGKMYAIDHDGQLRVKMLYKMPGGYIRLRSHNEKEWPDETVATADIKILGKVFWYSVLL